MSSKVVTHPFSETPVERERRIRREIDVVGKASEEAQARLGAGVRAGRICPTVSHLAMTRIVEALLAAQARTVRPGDAALLIMREEMWAQGAEPMSAMAQRRDETSNGLPF